MLFVGKAQEKATAYRTEKRRNPLTGKTCLWIVRATTFVNHYYFYCADRDFGPFFIKFCSYFPYNAMLYCNGNEWAKRQATMAGIAFEPLDNGFSSCADPDRLRRICARLGPKEIDRLVRKWLQFLPHTFAAADAAATATTLRSSRSSSD